MKKERYIRLSAVMHHKTRGFTLLELAAVIVILGVVAIFILPKFTNFRTESYKASVSGFAGAFKSTISTVHQQWVANGKPSSLTLKDGSVIDMNAVGYPISVLGDSSCLTLADSLLAAHPEVKEWQASGGDASGGYYVLGTGPAFCMYVIRGPLVDNVFRYFYYLANSGDVVEFNT